MSRTEKSFQNEEIITAIKEKLDVSTLNDFLINTPDKAINAIMYWEGKKLKATKEQRIILETKIMKLEALMEQMTDLTLDIFQVNAAAYIDTIGFVPDTAIEKVLNEVTDEATDAKVISIFDGEEEVKNPKLSDLAIAVKTLLKRGNFDSAELMATKYLSTGNYTPKKEKQIPDKWSEAKIASWIRDINSALSEEKRDTKKETVVESGKSATNKPVTDKSENTKWTDAKQKSVKGNEDAAAEGLTLGEVANLKLLKVVVPNAIPDHADYKTLREKLERYLHIGKTLNEEDEMLWAIASRIADAGDTITKVKLPEVELAKLFKDIDDFCKVFFVHRGYTEESVKLWRETVRKEKAPANFKYLRVDKDIDPLKLEKSKLTHEEITEKAKQLFLEGKNPNEIVASLESEILYKEIGFTKDKAKYSIYTKLHVRDLIARMFSAFATDPNLKPLVKEKVAEMAEPLLKSKGDEVDVNQIKTLIATLIGNGGILEDVKTHPEILGLLNKKIQVGSSAPLKFNKESILLPWIGTLFKEVNDKIEKSKIVEGRGEEPKEESKEASLANMLLLCETASKNDVSQEDFIKEHKDLIIGKDGKWKTMTDPADSKGTKHTVTLANQKDFEKWVSEVYEVQKKAKENAKPIIDTKDNKTDVVSSFKELVSKGKDLLITGITHDKFIEWLNKNLLNRKMREQAPEKVFKTSDAVAAFAKSTFGKELSKPVEVVNPTQPVGKTAEAVVSTAKEKDPAAPILGASETVTTELTVEEINTQIAEASKDKNATFPVLARTLRNLYVSNNIQIKDKTITVQEALNITDSIVKVSNPTMYEDRQKRKVKRETEKAAEAKAAKLETEDTTDPVVEEPEKTVDAEHQVFEKVDVQSLDPTLWETIEKFTTMDEVYNMALELNEADKFNEALSMCLVIMPTIEASKDWTSEQITEWFNANILKQTPKLGEENSASTKEDKSAQQETQGGKAASEESENAGNVESEKIGLEGDFKKLGVAANKKSFKQSIAAILKGKEDNEELRKLIINAIKTGTGAHTHKIATNTEKELHNMINNIKEKMGKFGNVEED